MARKKQDLLDALATFQITTVSGTETIAPLTGKETIAKLEELLASAEAENKQGPNPVEPAQSYIVKEYVQNGLRYRRIRTEKGEFVDVRI